MIGRACGSARTAARSASSKPPSGPISSAAGPGLATNAAAAGSPPSSSAKNSVRSAGQSRSSASSFTGLGQLGQRSARALLGRFGHDRHARASSFSLSATQRRASTGWIRRTAELGGLLEHEVEAVLLEQRRAEPEVGHLLARTQPLDRPQHQLALAGRDHLAPPIRR